MEEERRLCYVGMTRVGKAAVPDFGALSEAFGGGQPEATIPSRFFQEVPQGRWCRIWAERKNTLPEQYQARETARPNSVQGKTYNSVENIQQYFVGTRLNG